MTTELTKAAQQALEALRANAIHYGDPLRCSRDAIAALERALTQRPAAQTEREAFEAWWESDGPNTSSPYDAAMSGWLAGRAPQQATPEPVGEPVAWRWMPSHVFPTWVYSDDQNRVADARRFMGDGGVQALYTRPAPGVPEGWRNVIAGTLKTDPWDSARVADYNSGWNDCQRKTLRGLERLAAAQAKGGA